MARFYVRFDTKSQADLLPAVDYFDIKNSGNIVNFIGYSSASGALYRDGLIASRSLLSSDVYQDLDSTNQDGSKGIFFPVDLRQTDGAIYVSWSNAYTSSLEGIAIPYSNTYGLFTDVNYSKRPTSSVTSSMTNIIGPATPVDSIGVASSSFNAASQAVYDTLTKIIGGGPYSRLGNDPTRTLLSVWHDPDLNYFAWDDYTPGTPQATGAPVDAAWAVTFEGTRTWTGSIAISCSKEYSNDFNQLASASIYAELRYVSTSGVYPNPPGPGDSGAAATLNISFPIGDFDDVANITDAKSYAWTNIKIKTGSGLGENLDEFSTGVNLYVTMSFLDPLITSSRGAFRTFSVTTGMTAIVYREGFPITSNIPCFLQIGDA